MITPHKSQKKNKHSLYLYLNQNYTKHLKATMKTKLEKYLTRTLMKSCVTSGSKCAKKTRTKTSEVSFRPT